MKDAEYKVIFDHTDKLFKEWVDRVWLGDWKIRVKWRDERFNEGLDGHSPHTIATCSALWEYQDATITIAVPALGEYFEGGVCVDPNYVEYVVLHELAHVLVSQTREYDETRHKETVKHEEAVCTRLGKVLGYIRREALKEGQARVDKLETELREAREALLRMGTL